MRSPSARLARFTVQSTCWANVSFCTGQKNVDESEGLPLFIMAPVSLDGAAIQKGADESVRRLLHNIISGEH